MNDCKFEYYCFTESWLKPDIDSSFFKIDNYTIIRSDRSILSPSGSFIHGGGIICYIKNSMTSEIFDKPYITVDLEMVVIIINRPEQRKLYMIIIYHPPAGNLEAAFNIISETVRKIRLDTSRHTIILLGDFNVDCSPNKDQTRHALLLKNFAVNNGLQQFIDRPMRFGPVFSSIIDLMFTDSKFVSYHGTIAYYVSDHIPTFLVIKKPKETYTKASFIGRSYLKYCKDELQESITSYNWGSYYASFDVNTAWDLLYSFILKLSNIMCPVKTFHI